LVRNTGRRNPRRGQQSKVPTKNPTPPQILQRMVRVKQGDSPPASLSETNEANKSKPRETPSVCFCLFLLSSSSYWGIITIEVSFYEKTKKVVRS